MEANMQYSKQLDEWLELVDERLSTQELKILTCKHHFDVDDAAAAALEHILDHSIIHHRPGFNKLTINDQKLAKREIFNRYSSLLAAVYSAQEEMNDDDNVITLNLYTGTMN